uniref:Uncharacterized protein n=1 Tax=Acrobeloides nanus TaxID=290746 RepID=A0A914EEL7_9BILA
MNRLQSIERCVQCTSMEHQDNCPNNVRCIFLPHGIKEKFKKAFNKLHIYADSSQHNQKTIRPAKTNMTSRSTKNKARQTAKTNVINSIKPVLGNLIKAAPKAIKMLSQLHHNTTGPNGSNLAEFENEQNSEEINNELEESQSPIDNFSDEEQEDEDYSDVDEDAQDEEQEIEDYSDVDEDEDAQHEENQSEYDSYPENNESDQQREQEYEFPPYEPDS